MENNMQFVMYDGSSSPVTFVEHFRLQALFHDWDEAKQLTSLPLFLKGKAKRAYTAIVTKTAINVVLKGLIDACAQPQEVLLNEFFQRKQRQGESISKFAIALQDLLALADPTMPEDNQTRLLKAQICLSVPEHMRAMINFNPAMTWDNLIANLEKSLPHVIAYDNQQQQQATRWDSLTQQLVPTNMIKTEPLEANWLDTTRSGQTSGRPTYDNDSRPTNSNRNNSTQQRFNGNCNYCHRFGHKEIDCRTKARESQNYPTNNNNNHNRRGNNNTNSNRYGNNNSFNSRNNNRDGRNSNGFNNRRSYQNNSSQGTGNNNNSGNNQNVTTPNINSLNAQVADTNEDFPFYTAETSTVELQSCFKPAVALLKSQVKMVLFQQEPQIVAALIDGGSSHSFISPLILTQIQLQLSANRNNGLSERHNFEITSAISTTKSACCITKAQIQIGSWAGEHSFVISSAVNKHDMILGRDFFVKHKVIIDHSNDSMIIDNIHVNINSIVATASAIPRQINDTILYNHTFIPLAKPDNLLFEISNHALRQTNTTAVGPDDAAVCKVKTDTIITANSQRLIPFYTDTSRTNGFNTFMFEPSQPHINGCLIARSVHTNKNEMQYCNVINATDTDISFKQNQQIGIVNEAEIADNQFNEDIKNFVPLDTKKLIHFSGKTCSSKPIIDKSKKISEITTADILEHQIKTKLQFGNHLNPSQQDLLLAVLRKHEKAFQWTSNDIGRTNLVEHCIPTGNAAPIQQKQYPIPSIAREHMNVQVADMLKNNFIRTSTSSWRSPVLLVKKTKTDGSVSYRFCVDLKKVNSVTVKDCYSLPRISETVDALSGAKFFTTLDIDRAYWQIGLQEQDKCKTAFVMDGKLFEFNVMPFGSMNAPSTFQRLMDRVLGGLTWKQCLVYIDDVLIFSRTFDEHLRAIDEVLSRFRYAKLRLKPAKCRFADNEVEYLGFRITDKGIKPTNTKLEAIINVKPPEKTKQLFGFLCSINYYRSLIPNYGRLTADLYKMCEGRARRCSWTKESLKNFANLKQAFISAPILSFPNFKLPFYIQTDASNNAIGAVLLQLADNLYKPIAFASRKLSETEKRYSATERELLGIVYAYEQFHSHVYGRHIKFYTDHEPLVTMCKLKNPLGRLGRLFHRLQDVDHEILYVPGSENFLPDFLSRSFEIEESSINNIELISTINWFNEQSKDLEIQKVIELVNNHATDARWLAMLNGRRWLRDKNEFYVASGILKHSTDKIVCPQHLKSVILQSYHDSPFSGHRAYETTLIVIRSRYYWNFMPSEVKAYCQSCLACQKYNYACLHNCAPLKSIHVSRPWQLVGIDFMGPFKTSQHGNKYIILAIDHFTKYVEAAATPSFDALTTAIFLFNNIICRYGMIEKLLSDQGVNFESNLIKQLCELLGTKKLHTSTYHAAGNGITERVNKNVKPNLAKFVNDSHDDWYLFLQMAISSYNNSYHSSIRMCPYEAVFGRKPVLVSDIILGHQLTSSTRIKDIADFTYALRISASTINEMIYENTTKAQNKQKLNYDRFIKDKAVYRVGDVVKINNFRSRIGHTKAFEPKFLGPYTITKLLGDLNYQLESPNLPKQVVHYNRMLKFHVRSEVTNKVNSDKYQNLSFERSDISKAITPYPLFIPLAHSKHLKDLKKKKTNQHLALQTELERMALIDVSDNTVQSKALVPYIASEEDLIEETIEQVIRKAHTSSEHSGETLAMSDDESSSSESDNERGVLFNDKGKPVVPCPWCQQLFEKKTGLRIHLLSCKKKIVEV